MKQIIEVVAWVINHWLWWGILFATTGGLKIAEYFLNKTMPNIFS